MNWNPDYVMRTYDLVTRRRLLEHWMKDAAPASYAVIAATVVATAGLLRAFRRPLTDADRLAAGLTALLLGVVLEAALLQPRVHPYVFAPAIFIAFAVLAAAVRLLESARWVTPAAAVLALALFARPVFGPPRVTHWKDAFAPQDALALRDEIGTTQLEGRAEWRDLRTVAAFLEAQRVGDGDVLCFNDTPHALYLMLGIEPPIRFMQWNLLINAMPSHRAEVREQLARSRARFVVSDLGGMVPNPRTADVPGLWSTRYPWNLPVLLRAGRYFVHPHSADVAPFWRE